MILSFGRYAIVGFIAFTLLGCSPPLTPEELMVRAELALEARDYSAAELDVKTVLQADPENAQARSMYGDIYTARFNPSAAAAQYERSVGSSDSNSVRVKWAKALVEASEHDQLMSLQAEGQFLPVQVDPEFQSTLARTYLYRAEYESGREALAKSAGSDSSYAKVTQAIYAVQLENDWVRANELLDAVVAEDENYAHAWSLKGLLALKSQSYADSAEYFGRAATISPYRLADRIQFVTASIRAGDIDAAEVELARLEELLPNNPEVNFLRGQLFFDAGNYENALDRFAQTLTINPDHLGALFLSANANARENNLGTAQRQFTQFLSEMPGNLEAGLQLANVWRLLDRPQDMEETAREILKEHAMDTRALGVLALALSLQGQNAESAQVYEQIAALQPESIEAKVALGSQQMIAGDLGSGLEQLEAAVALDPENNLARERLIEAYLGTGDTEAALNAATDYVANHPDSARAVVLLGRVHLVTRDLDQAKDAFEQALEMDPGNQTASGGLATIALFNQDIDAAREIFEKSLNSKPGDLQTSMNLAVILEKSGELDAMGEVLQAAVEANPGALEPRVALARFRLAQSKPGEAVELVKPLEATLGDEPQVHQILATAYLAVGQPESAANSARKLTTVAQNDPASLALVARVESANGRHESAQQYLESALEIAPDSTDLKKLLVDSLLLQGALEEAEDAIADLPLEVQQQPQTLVVRGRLALAKRDVVEAEELFKQSFDLQPSGGVLVLLSSVRWQQGRKEEAVRGLEAWLVNNSEDLFVRNALAAWYLENGEQDKAVGQYRKIVEQQPNNALALNNLAWMLKDDELEAAFEYVKRADELAPQSGQIKDTYAMIELARGNTKRALALNSKAQEATPSDLEVRYNRAQILIAADQEGEAQQILRELVAGPAFASQSDAKALLDSL